MAGRILVRLARGGYTFGPPYDDAKRDSFVVCQRFRPRIPAEGQIPPGAQNCREIEERVLIRIDIDDEKRIESERPS
jgi:hypothetical protein